MTRIDADDGDSEDHDEAGGRALRTAAGEVVGTDFDVAQAEARRAARSPWRRLRHWLSWHLVGLVAVVWPRLYEAYCAFVWWSSSVSDDVDYRLGEAKRRHGRVLALLWHQEVFTVAWGYQRLRPHTLASAGDFGRIITHMLERLGFLVFRGGSSGGSSRRRNVLPAMVRHMRESSDEVLYGITVDGSNGPAWVMKPGGAMIARACRAPVYVIRTASSACIELGTWDRTAIPLPFGRIAIRIAGPYWIEPDADGPQLERFRAHVEAELLDLAWAVARELDPRAQVPDGFPEGWEPRWPADAALTPSWRGIPLGPYDLRPRDPPPWASRPGPQEDDGPARRAARRAARGVA